MDGGHAWLKRYAWQGACMARGGNAWQEVGHAWQGDVCGRGHAWQEGSMHGRRDGHYSGRHASYWNAFLFLIVRGTVFEGLESLFINFKQTKRFSDIKQYLQTVRGLFVQFTEPLVPGFGLCPGL